MGTMDTRTIKLAIKNPLGGSVEVTIPLVISFQSEVELNTSHFTHFTLQGFTKMSFDNTVFFIKDNFQIKKDVELKLSCPKEAYGDVYVGLKSYFFHNSKFRPFTKPNYDAVITIINDNNLVKELFVPDDKGVLSELVLVRAQIQEMKDNWTDYVEGLSPSVQYFNANIDSNVEKKEDKISQKLAKLLKKLEKVVANEGEHPLHWVTRKDYQVMTEFVELVAKFRKINIRAFSNMFPKLSSNNVFDPPDVCAEKLDALRGLYLACAIIHRYNSTKSNELIQRLINKNGDGIITVTTLQKYYDSLDSQKDQWTYKHMQKFLKSFIDLFERKRTKKEGET